MPLKKLTNSFLRNSRKRQKIAIKGNTPLVQFKPKKILLFAGFFNY
jgi:hypothetical protein